VEWAPVYHVKGWGKFNRHYGDFCTGADNSKAKTKRRILLSSYFVDVPGIPSSTRLLLHVDGYALDYGILLESRFLFLEREEFHAMSTRTVLAVHEPKMPNRGGCDEIRRNRRRGKSAMLLRVSDEEGVPAACGVQGQGARKASQAQSALRGEPSARYRREWRCPNCHSSELKRVSLAYEEGRSRLAGRTRLRGMIFGDDANVIVGTAVTNGIAQTELFKRLRPPQKWSYGKLILRAGLAFLASLVILIRFVMASSAPVSSVGIVIFGAIGLGTFVAMSVLIWGHNHLVYPTQHAEWNDSWVCPRCGGVTSQRLG
jgi:rubredoxin